MQHSCKKMAELLSQGMDRPLTLRERVALRLHLMLCDGCRNFSRQLTALRNIARRVPGMLDRED